MDAFITALPTILKAMAMGAVPILLASLGELFSERGGLVNIGLEGVMAIGAFVGFAVAKVSGNLWLGFLVAMLAGIVINMIYAFCTVTLCSDQVVTGMAINILAPAIALFGYKNRKAQMRKTRWAMLLDVAYYVALSVHVWLHATGGGLTPGFALGCLCPLLSFLFLWLALRAIRKDEALVRAADRIR